MKDFNDFLSSLGEPELARDLEKKFTMFVKNFDDTKWGKKIAFPSIVMEKFDGVCALLILINGKAKLFSRTGRTLSNVDHIARQFENVSHHIDNTVTMVEICHDGISLEQISGIVNPNRSNPVYDDLLTSWLDESYLAAYDQVLLNEFLAGKSPVPFKVRFQDLLDLIPLLKLPLQRPVWIEVQDESEMEDFFEGYVNSGGEGIVIAQLDAPWVAGYKNHHKTKKVRGVDFDLEVLDVIEGTGKHKGMAGKLLVRWRKFGLLENKAVKLPVDGRFTEEERILMLENPTHYIGSIVHVHALQIGSAGSLRLAKVRSFRIDKDFADL